MPRAPEEAVGAPSLRHRLERSAVRGVLALARRLPDGAATRLADLLAVVMRTVVPGRVRLAREQIAAALGRSGDDPQVAAWARACFRHFLGIPLELIHAPAQVERHGVAALLELADRHHLDEALARGRGAILLTGHFGNWELYGLLSPLLGLPMTGVARPMKNLLLDAELLALRTRYGQKIVPKEGAGLKLARTLRDGGIVALLIDQHAGSRGVRVPFFHADASTFTLAASLSRRFGAPIVPWFARATALHKVAVRFEAPLAVDLALPDDEDAWRLTDLFHRRLEAAIRADPQQYLWFHRRWKKGGVEPDPRWRERYARPLP